MNQEKKQKILKQVGILQNQILQYSAQMFQLSSENKHYAHIIENMLTKEAQLQALYWVLNEEEQPEKTEDNKK